MAGIEKLEQYKNAYDIVYDALDKGNLMESWEGMTNGLDKGVKYMLNVKDNPEDNWNRDSWFYKKWTGIPYTQLSETEAAAYGFIKEKTGYDLRP